MDTFWLSSIFLQFITLRYHTASYNIFDIMLSYVKNEFLFDIVATLPTMLTGHSRWILILRSIHVVQLSKVDHTLKRIAKFVYPNSLITQDTFFKLMKFLVTVFISAHYFVFLWVFIGDKIILGEAN